MKNKDKQEEKNDTEKIDNYKKSIGYLMIQLSRPRNGKWRL